MKKRRCGRWAAALLTAALLAGTLAGCGGQEGDKGSGAGSDVGSDVSGTEDDTAAEQSKGRYVEKQEALPQELEGWSIVQMYKVDGKLRFLASKQEDGKTVLSEWEKQGEGYGEVTPGWLASMDLPAAEWMEMEISYGEGGKAYLYTGYTAEGEEAFRSHLWKGEGDTAQEITPEAWNVPSEMTGGYEMLMGMAALKNGTLATISYTAESILSGEDGSILESSPIDIFYEGGIVTDGENTYLRLSGGQIEKRKDGKREGSVSIPYPGGTGADNSSGGLVVEAGGTGNLALDVLEDGTLIGAGEKGIFRLDGGAAEGQWELLVQGIETDFAMEDCWCMDFAALEDGSIYALFETGGERKLNRYEYDPDAVSEVKEVLKLYTVYENSLLKQAAVMYHKAHPEVMIDIQHVYPMYFLDTPDYDAVYQELNTMLMGDGAPDIVVMDHLNIDSYADKGLLADLGDAVKPLEDSGELLSNITGTYVREDGKRYVVPLQFFFNMAMGRDIPAESMGSIEALADFLSKADYSYLGDRTVAELVDEFYPYFCAEIIDGKQLDREAMGKYLGYLKAIGDNCGMIPARPEDELALGMWELVSDAKLAFKRTTGFTDCMFPMSIVDYIKGEFTAFENRFEPSMQMGICSKSRYIDTAKDFLQFALSQQVQDLDSYNGFPVNGESLKKLAAKDRSQYSATTMIKADSGSYIEFESKAYPQETAEKLADMCRELDKPVKEDAKVREVLIECLGPYLDGSQSQEDTIQKIEDGLKMYLAE